MLPGTCENQRIVQNATPIGFGYSLKTGHRSREDSGIAPYLAIRTDHAMRRHSIEYRYDLFNDMSGSAVAGIQQSASRC